MYQELVDKCKSAYQDRNMALALRYWNEIYEILHNKLDKLDIQDEKERFKVWEEHNNYMEQFTNEEVYSITDYGKRIAYEKQAREDIFEDREQIFFGDITKELDILDDFCDMYAWCPIKNKDNTYNIIDTELNKIVDEDEDYKTIEELVNRVVGRAIAYFRDEMCWEESEEEERINYGKSLYNIALEYRKEDKWEKEWLKAFKEELEG